MSLSSSSRFIATAPLDICVSVTAGDPANNALTLMDDFITGLLGLWAAQAARGVHFGLQVLDTEGSVLQGF